MIRIRDIDHRNVVSAAGALVLLLATAACSDGWMSFDPGTGASFASDPVVVFLGETTVDSLPPEEAAAWQWLSSREGPEVRYLQLVDLASSRLPRNAVIWWHHAGKAGLPAAAVRDRSLNAVRRHLRDGGSLLLTLLAASYTVPLGLESEPPVSFIRASTALPDAEFGGVQARLGHPLLRGVYGGTLTSATEGAGRRPAAVYTAGRAPVDGNVWAVHKDEHDVHASIKIGVEYVADATPSGVALTIGAHCYFSDPPGSTRPQLEALVGGALDYLARATFAPADAFRVVPVAAPGDGSGRLGRGTPEPADSGGTRGPGGLTGDVETAGTDGGALGPRFDLGTRYWPTGRQDLVMAGNVPPSAPPIPAAASSLLNAVEGARSGPELESYPEGRDLPFTVSSPLGVANASQLGRIDELWTHPFRILRNLRFAIVRPQRGVTWLDEGTGARTFIARPEGAELRYNDGDVEVSLYLSADRRTPGIAAILAVRSPAAVDLIASWEVDMAASWPRDESLLGPLTLGWDAGAHAAVWSDGAGSYSAMAGFGRPDAVTIRGYLPDVHLGEQGLIPDESAAASPYASRAVATQVRVEPGRPALLPFIVAGGPGDAPGGFVELLAQPGRPWLDNADHFAALLDSTTLKLLVPDTALVDAFKWAKIGAEALRVRTDELGEAAFTGYGDAMRRPGWLSRPGAFGADALWLAMAADSYGDRGLAADTLRLVARHQRLDGRLPAALTPSWQADYSRLGVLPLFLIAVENHVRTWGDTDLLEQLWPAVVAALEHARAADADADGLLDAGSRLDRWGADASVTTTIDLVGLWGAALEAVETMASWRGDTATADQARTEAAAVRAALNDTFWDPLERSFHFGKRRDGGSVSVRTALAAVPMVFGLLDGGIATAELDALAGPLLSTDWGVILYRAPPPASEPPEGDVLPSASEPSRLPGDPATYVSPLLTGWAALASYANHRAESGFVHAVTNLRLLAHNDLGRAPEILPAERFGPAGSNPHAAASQAMTILPITRGLLGLRVDAIAGILTIDPHLPGGWGGGRVIVSPVRLGSNEFRLQIEPTFTRTRFVIQRLRGDDDVLVRLGAHVPNDVPISLEPNPIGATVEEQAAVEEGPADHFASVGVRLTANRAIVSFRHAAFPQLVPPGSNLPGVPAETSLQPGASSTGIRVIRTRYRGDSMRLELAGLPGQRYTLRLATPWPVQRVDGVPEVTFANPEPGQATLDVLIPGSGPEYRPVDLEVFFDR